MDILVGKSKLIKVGSMVLVAVFIIICYQLDVGAAKGNSKMLSTYFTYSGKFRVEVEVLDIKETSSIEDCNGIYFCQVVKQAPVYGGIDLAIAIIIILIELLEKPVLKDKIQPDLLKNIIFISLLIGFGFALATMLQFWFAAGSDYNLCAGSQILIVLYNLLFGFSSFVQFKVKSSQGQDTLLS
ncbi:unnamed protein product (macronuclear) [Paramecium tetraurelia]|uniref:MARVEL domain-containing protein n=1 Tax=Paramecium tetraurelia TaxID=5888 RepID=A0DH31_PARTE|nr:uncharacterized protein GSPATT00016734001 [Paramecium tetraurelia]CAK82348.1 unnamed protein product [Paramecium tetraurelia]|eukprot:XP_001449745.1 hypothetical protein (macronuclear) [Paramecium tetraurelia strain d4-2]